MDHKPIQSRLGHVYWLGGAPCSGKSTIADELGTQYGLDIYHVDEAIHTRFGPYSPHEQPCMHRWTTSAWDQLWMRPVTTLLDEVFECYSEQFDLVLYDLLRVDDCHKLLVEGNSLLPNRVVPLLLDRSHALWLTPTAHFQRVQYPQRGAWVQSILGHCGDPQQAFRNWMDRDVAFAERIRNQVRDLDLPHIAVDGSCSIHDTVRLVAIRFGLADDKEEICS